MAKGQGRWVRDDLLNATMSQVEYAAHAQVSKQYVNQMVNNGDIPVSPEGKIDAAAADHARGKHQPPEEGAETGDGTSSENAEDDNSPGSVKTIATGENDTLTEARKVKLKYEGMTAKLDYEERAGNLVRVRDVESLVEDLFGRIVEKLNLMPQKVAGRLVPMVTEREIAVALEEALNTSLSEFADEVEAGALGRPSEQRLAS